MTKTPKLLTLALGFSLTLGVTSWAESHAESPEFEITGDATAGERVFRRCAACHEVGEGAVMKVGPVLNGVVGSMAGSSEEFEYSPALLDFAAAEELMWTPETLDAFLTKPRDYIDGTKMTYVGLRKEDDRANLIAYLATFPASEE